MRKVMTCAFWLVLWLVGPGVAAARDVPPAAQRREVCLNGEWQGAPATDENTLPGEADFTQTLPVPGIFGQWFDEMPGKRAAHKTWYRLMFRVPAAWQDGRRVSLAFRSVDHYAKAYLNRQVLGEHTCGLIPFAFDITPHAAFGELNELLVYVEDTARTISTPEARAKALAEPWTNWRKKRAIMRAPNDYPVREAYMPGISGDVFLRSTPPVHIADVFAKPSVRNKALGVDVRLVNASADEQTVTVRNDVYLEGDVALALPDRTVTVPAGGSADVTVTRTWPAPKLWGYGEYGSATLYFVRTELAGPGVRDTRFTRFGFREVWAEGRDLYFNGRKWFIQGDCEDNHGHGTMLIHANTRAFLTRYFEAERRQNINNVRNGWRPAHAVWFDVADEMGMTLEPSTGISGYPNPVNRRTDQWFAAEYVRSIRNHPSIVILSSNNEAASQGGGAISPGNDPEVWTSLKLVQDVIKEHDGTRLVSHQGSPRIMLAGKFERDFPIDIWNIHPYGDPLVNSLRRHMQEFGYDGSVPCVIGEHVAKKSHLPKEIELLREYPGEAYGVQLQTARYWAGTIRDIRAEGVAGIQLLSLMVHGYWGASSPTEVSAGPYDGLPDRVPIAWPSRSGPGPKPSVHIWYHKLGLVNYLRPGRPLVVPNVIAQHVRAAYREANGGEDLPPVPDRRAPEIIVAVTVNGRPATNAYVYLEPLGGQAANVRGVMADRNGKAWFVLAEPGRYRARTAVDDRSGSVELTARWGSLRNDPMPWGHVDTFTLALDGNRIPTAGSKSPSRSGRSSSSWKNKAEAPPDLTGGVMSKDRQPFYRGDGPPTARSATIVVAAADSPERVKAQADFVCAGLDDHLVMNAAIEALPATGGRIHLSAGVFSIGGVKGTHGGISIFRSNVLLTGEGSGTRLVLQDGLTDINVIWIAEKGDVGISDVTIRDLCIDGNGKKQAPWVRARSAWKGGSGIKSTGMSGGASRTPRKIRVANCHIENCQVMAVMLTGEAVEVQNCYFTGKFGSHVIELLGDSGRIEGCTLRVKNGDSAGYGFSTDHSHGYHIINNKILVDAGGRIRKHPINNWPAVRYGDGTRPNLYHGIIAGNMVINNGTTGSVLINGYMDMVHNNIFRNVPVVIGAPEGGMGVVFEHNMLINSPLKINSPLRGEDCVIFVNGNEFFNSSVTHEDGNVVWGTNPGYATENSGTASISGDKTAVVVEHGLAAAATRVQVTPANSMGAATKFWVEAITDRHFTIRLDPAPGTDATFQWQAATGGQARRQAP